jgi:hypothetical protein
MSAISQVYISGTGTAIDGVYNIYLGKVQDGRFIFANRDGSAAVYHSNFYNVWIAALTPSGVITDNPEDYFSGSIGAYPSNEIWAGRGAYSSVSVRPTVEGIMPLLNRIIRAIG